MANIAMQLSEIFCEGFESLGEYIAEYNHCVGAPFPIYVAIRFITTIAFTCFILLLAGVALVMIFLVTIFALCGDAIRKLYTISKNDWHAHRRSNG